MKISLKWINDYVDINDYMSKPQELASLLTFVGLEVESIENQAQSFNNVVVGVILEKDQHPGADRLTVCQVSTSQGKVHQIVCGAKNHKKGDRVVAALPGAILPGDFAIKTSTLRGVESNGMLCSESELGIQEESEGIMILPEDAPIGENFAQYWGLDDVILEIKVTPNRADCLSHFGLAREIATVLNRPFDIKFGSLQETKESTQDIIKLKVVDEMGCPRYAGRVIKNVKVQESPLWLKKRLESVGLKSINNVVDVTNYVMMELGQPLHAFDIREIKGSQITVSRATPNEKFKTLDGTEILLNGDELAIRDNERVVALAGVIGGLNSGVTDSTKDIFIECAYFDPAIVRKTSRAHGIETDSAYRFSRGVNPDAILFALNRASELMVKLADGEALGHHHDYYPRPIRRSAIKVNIKYMEDKLGYVVEAEDFSSWMLRLGCQVKSLDAETFEVLPPIFRWDIEFEEDLIEEYARLNGYDKIPESFPPLRSEPTSHAASYVQLQQLSLKLREFGYAQCVNLGFINKKWQEQVLGDIHLLKPLQVDEPVRIKNPLSEEDVMRTSLIPGLINNLTHNYRYGVQWGKLFEIGEVFKKSADEYIQMSRLSMLSWGEPISLWQQAPRKNYHRVIQLKSELEEVLERLRISGVQWVESKEVPSYLHPGQAIALRVADSVVGFVGTLHPLLQEDLKLRVPVALCEIDLDKTLKLQRKTLKIKTPAKFPIVERDLAFVVPNTMSSQVVKKEIQKLAGNLLKDIFVFDVFEGAPLKESEKSMAFKMYLQDDKNTLSEEVLTSLQNSIIDGLAKKLNIRIR